ncbi:hypothetical protein YC2023_104961 [Brassica napus]
MLFIWHQVRLMSTFRFSLLFKIYVLGSNPEIKKLVNPEEVTKAAIETAVQIYAYIKKKFAREGLSNAYPQLMICSEPATSWYYIACSDCKTKATREPSSLLCPKFGNINVSGIAAATREEKFPLSSEVRRDDPGSETYCIRVPPDINSRILRLLLP